MSIRRSIRDYFKYDFEFSIALLMIVFVLMFFGLIASVGDIVFQVKAEPKVVACRTQQMDHMRYSFTDSVICVPFPSRQDTLTLSTQ